MRRDEPLRTPWKYLEGIAVALILVISFFLMWGSCARDVPTYDEPLYVTSGFYYLRTGDFSLNPEHPPLVKDLVALPLCFSSVNYPDLIPMDKEVQNEFARKFFYGMGNHPDRMLALTRLPAILLTLLTFLLVYWWARRCFGGMYALLALLLMAFNPLFLGYGKLTIQDQAVALFILATLFAYYQFLRAPSTKRLLICALAFGLAQLTKFTTLSLIPIMFLLACAEAWIEKKTVRGRALLLQLGRLAAIFAVGFLLVLLVYGIHINHMSRKDQLLTIRLNLPPNDPWADNLESVSRISPPLAQYLLGLAKTWRFFQIEYPAYLGGKIYWGGVWYFPFYSFLFKTPLALLLAALIFIPAALSRLRDREIQFFALPILVLFLLSLRVTKVFGVRYILSIYPPLVLLIVAGAHRFLSRQGLRKVSLSILALLAAFLVVSALISYPHYISFFNEAVGCRDQAYRYLIDSDLDWGQDLRRLADYVEEEGIEGIKVHYFGGGDVHYYLPSAVEWRFGMDRPQGWFAISITIKQLSLALELVNGESYRWLDQLRPQAVIGHTIWVYYIP